MENITNAVYRLVSRNSIVKQFSKIVEYLVNGGLGLYCEKFFLRSIFFSRGVLSTFIQFSLGKAGPFTLENHIHVKALKMQGFPNN